MTTAYTIQMASKISGVGVHTIRAWEKRYKALEPARDSSGHRTYTKTDIEKLMLLSELCLLGYTISKVANFDIAQLKLILKDLGKNETSIDSPDFSLIKEKSIIDSSGPISILLFALRNYKLDVINQELQKLKVSLSARELALKIILPLFHEIQNLKASGLCNLIQEEVLTSLIHFHAGFILYQSGERHERSGVNVSVIGALNNSNDLGLMMAGLICHQLGFHYTVLGSKLSVDALIDTISFLNTDLIILNALTVHNIQDFNKEEIQYLIEKIAAKNSTVEVILLGKINLNLEKISTKRFKKIETLDELDDYLSRK